MKKLFLLTAVLLLFCLCLAGCGDKHCNHENLTYTGIDDYQHKTECVDCDELSYQEDHSYGDWIVDQSPVDLNQGTRHRQCSRCNYVQNGTFYDPQYFDEHNFSKTVFVYDDVGTCLMALHPHHNDENYSFPQGGYFTCNTINDSASTDPDTFVFSANYKGIPIVKYDTLSSMIGDENTKKIVVEEGIEYVGFQNNYATDLYLPKTIKEVECYSSIYNVYFHGTPSDYVNSGLALKYDDTRKDFDGFMDVELTVLHTCSDPYEEYKPLSISCVDECVQDINFYFTSDGQNYTYNTTIILDESVTEIPDYCFCGMEQIKEVVAPGVTKIGDYAFANLPNLKKVEFGEIEKLGKGSFAYDMALRTQINLSGELKEIPEKAFYHCYNLRNMELKEGLEKIGDSALGCTYHLYELTLPASLNEIGYNAIFGPEEVYAADGSIFANDYLPLTYESKIKYLSNGAVVCDGKLLGYDKEHNGKIVISDADGASSLSSYAFAYDNDLLAIDLPQSVIHVGFYSLDYCPRLMQVVFRSNTYVTVQTNFEDDFSLVEIYVDKNADTSSLFMPTETHCYLHQGFDQPSRIFYKDTTEGRIYFCKTDRFVKGDQVELGNECDGTLFIALFAKEHNNATKKVNTVNWRDAGVKKLTAKPFDCSCINTATGDETIIQIALSNFFDAFSSQIEEVVLSSNIYGFGYTADIDEPKVSYHPWDRFCCPFAYTPYLKGITFESNNYTLPYHVPNLRARTLLNGNND